MQLLAFLLIGLTALGGVVDACANIHPDHADRSCLDDCCQPVWSLGFSTAISAALLMCERLVPAGGGLNDDFLARSHFRPPEAV